MLQATINATNDTNQFSSIRLGGSNFLTTRNASAGDNGPDPNDVGCFANLTAGTYFILRGFLSYDLSSIPAQAEVVSAQEKVYTLNLQNIDNDSFYIVEGTQSNPIVLGDYDQVVFTSLGSLTISSMSNNSYATIDLNSNALTLIKSKLATTLKLAHVMGRDFNSVAPSGEGNQVNVQPPSGANPPQLIVNYRLPTGAQIF